MILKTPECARRSTALCRSQSRRSWERCAPGPGGINEKTTRWTQQAEAAPCQDRQGWREIGPPRDWREIVTKNKSHVCPLKGFTRGPGRDVTRFKALTTALRSIFKKKKKPLWHQRHRAQSRPPHFAHLLHLLSFFPPVFSLLITDFLCAL